VQAAWHHDRSRCSKCAELFNIFRHRKQCQFCGLDCCAMCAPLSFSLPPRRTCKSCKSSKKSTQLLPRTGEGSASIKNTFINVDVPPPSWNTESVREKLASF
jgi:hypothetical protein